MTTLGAFYKQKPANVQLWTTLEFYHPDFGLLRYILNQYADTDLTLEADAPRNGGEVVTFEPIAAIASDPEQTEFGASIDVQFGRAGAQIKEKINAMTIAGRRTPIEVIWRKYVSDVTTAPAQFYYLQSSSVNFRGRNGAIVAQQRNVRSYSVLRVYKDDEFKGLALNA